MSVVTYNYGGFDTFCGSVHQYTRLSEEKHRLQAKERICNLVTILGLGSGALLAVISLYLPPILIPMLFTASVLAIASIAVKLASLIISNNLIGVKKELEKISIVDVHAQLFDEMYSSDDQMNSQVKLSKAEKYKHLNTLLKKNPRKNYLNYVAGDIENCRLSYLQLFASRMNAEEFNNSKNRSPELNRALTLFIVADATQKNKYRQMIKELEAIGCRSDQALYELAENSGLK